MLTIEKTNEMIDALVRNADMKRDIEIAAANSYHDGYVDGCENLGKQVRQILYNMRIEKA